MGRDPVELAKIHEMLGKLTANIEGLRRDFDRFDDASREYRHKVHNRLDDAVERLVEVEASVKGLESYSKEAVKPTVDFVQGMRQRGVGFLAAAGIVGTGAGAALATTLYYYWGKVIKLLQAL